MWGGHASHLKSLLPRLMFLSSRPFSWLRIYLYIYLRFTDNWPNNKCFVLVLLCFFSVIRYLYYSRIVDTIIFLIWKQQHNWAVYVLPTSDIQWTIINDNAWKVTANDTFLNRVSRKSQMVRACVMVFVNDPLAYGENKQQSIDFLFMLNYHQCMFLEYTYTFLYIFKYF